MSFCKNRGIYKVETMAIVEQFPCTNLALRLRQWAQGPDAIYKVRSSRGAIPANVQKRVDKFSRTEKSD